MAQAALKRTEQVDVTLTLTMREARVLKMLVAALECDHTEPTPHAIYTALDDAGVFCADGMSLRGCLKVSSRREPQSDGVKE